MPGVREGCIVVCLVSTPTKDHICGTSLTGALCARVRAECSVVTSSINTKQNITFVAHLSLAHCAPGVRAECSVVTSSINTKQRITFVAHLSLAHCAPVRDRVGS